MNREIFFMSTVLLELTKKQAFKALSRFPKDELQTLIRDLIKAKFYSPPKVEELYKKCSSAVKKHKTPISVIEEAKQWVRSQRSF
jgi:hypothetical protein